MRRRARRTSFAAHDSAVRALRFVDVPGASAPVLATGSWDRTVRYWDVRDTGKPVATLACKDRVYAMDTGGSLLVIGTAELHVHVVDLARPGAFKDTIASPPQAADARARCLRRRQRLRSRLHRGALRLAQAEPPHR